MGVVSYFHGQEKKRRVNGVFIFCFLLVIAFSRVYFLFTYHLWDVMIIRFYGKELKKGLLCRTMSELIYIFLCNHDPV